MLSEVEVAELIGERIAGLLADELEKAAESSEFGLIVQDVTPLNLEHLLGLLAQRKCVKKKNLRLALVGEQVLVDRTLQGPVWDGLLAADEETAVQWRNLRARTIVVVTSHPLAKAASMRDFRVVTEQDLIRNLCKQQRDTAEVTWLRTLWDALDRGRRLRISLPHAIWFAQALEGLDPSERSAHAPHLLHLLGLFPDEHLADEKSDAKILRRLNDNRDLVTNFRRASEEDWSRIRAYCKALSGSAKTAANRLARVLKERLGASYLEGIDFAEALALWRAKVSSRPGKGGGQEKVAIECTVGRLLMEEEEAPLHDIAEEMSQLVQAVLDDPAFNGTQDIKGATTVEKASVVQVDRDVLILVRSRSTEEEWGGLIEVASDKPEALLEVNAFKSWTPFNLDTLRQQLEKFADEAVQVVPPILLELLTRYEEVRKGLLPYACELALSPVSTLAGKPGLLARCEAYLGLYEDLLRQLSTIYPEMREAADEEAEEILASLLALELYVYKKDGQQVEAVMSPLHPLYLWRSATVVREIRGLAKALSEQELQTLEEACAEDTQHLQVLVIPRQLAQSETPLLLGQAGMLGRLPIFREAPRGVLEADGTRTIADLAERLANLRPFVRPGLQIVLVNLPHPNRFLVDLVARLEMENTAATTFWGLHVRVRYTQADTQGWGSEVASLEDDLKELINNGEERGLVSLSVQNEIMPWDQLVKELQDLPAHLAVVMDPFAVRTSPVARAQSHRLTPWMPTCEYRFNHIRKEILVVPVAEENVFGSYLAAASQIHSALKGKSPAHIPQVKEMKEILEKVAVGSLWTVLGDPHRVPIARLGKAEVIDRRMEGNRQFTCFTTDLSPFMKRLDSQLRQTHFQADTETLERLIRDLVAMEPNGVLGLAGSFQDKQVKGSLGKLIALRWYRMHDPSGLAVSLDTPAAQRWLVAGGHSKEKADLLGLKEEDGGLVIDVLEVKAHDEKVPYTITDDLIEGHCVGQVLATMQALAEVFAPGELSPLARPRREVLREHLYTAVLRDQDPIYIQRWHAMLEDLFSGKVPVRLAGRIVHVQLASVAPRASRVCTTKLGIPIRVDTLSAEDVGLVLHPSRRIRVDKSPVTELLAERGLSQAWQVGPKEALGLLLAGVKESTQGNSCPAGVGESSEAVTAPTKPVPDGPTVEVASVDLATEPSAGSPLVQLKVLLGTVHASSEPVYWQPSSQSNGFFLILGASGSGKTETLKVLASAVVDSGIPVLVFDFHGDVTFPGVNSFLLSSGSASTVGLNPLELDIHSAEESGLYDQRAALRGLIQRAVPALRHLQSKILRDAFEEAYLNAGIQDGDTSTWLRPAPTFKDLQDLLTTWAEDDARKSQRTSIEGCLAALQELFGHPIFRREEHLSMDKLFAGATRLDLSKLPDQIRFIATETLLRKIFRVLKLQGPIPVQPADDRERFRLFVVIDEAKILSLGSGDRDRSGHILNELITEARKFGLGMILASQMVEHFSEEVRGNAATRLVLKPNDIAEAKKNAPTISVDPEELLFLAGRGDGFYRDRPSSRARRIQVRPLGSRG